MVTTNGLPVSYEVFLGATFIPKSLSTGQKCHSAICRGYKKAIVEQHQETKLALLPSDKNAITFLSGLLSLPELTIEQRNLLTNAQHIIRLKKYQKLATDLAKLRKNSAKIKPLVILAKALVVLDSYNITADIINTDPDNQGSHKLIL